MDLKYQHTLKNEYTFEGKGLHTGRVARMTVKPAPVDYGIKFIRTDLDGLVIEALAENVGSTERSTTIVNGEASISTIEHIMSALAGLGIDNAQIEINNAETPILDGSAGPYVTAFKKDGLVKQDALRHYIELEETIEIKNEKTGSYIKLEPADSLSFDIKVDFGSRVLGIQEASWDMTKDYAEELGYCRTFVFFHELEFLFKNNLIKGGDADNAIVIVEHPVSDEQLDKLSSLFGMPKLEISQSGYLNNLELHFPNECGRHKLLDLIGDMRLSGGYPKAKITAFKPGHSINTTAARKIRDLLKK